MRRLFYFLFIGFLLLTNVAWSQRSFLFRNYTLEDGLSQSSVTAIAQDENYALWIGTQDGLNRFDGHSFEVYTSANTPQIPNDFIQVAFRASDNLIWFGTENGVFYYNPRLDRFIGVKHRLSTSLRTQAIAEDENGRIWIGTANNGLLYADKNDTIVHKFIPFDALKDITSMTLMDKNNLAVIANGYFYQVNIADRSVRKITEGFESHRLTILSKINPSEYLLGTLQGAFIYNISNKTLREISKAPFEKEEITALNFDENYFFIGTNSDGLYVVNRKNGQITHSQRDYKNRNALMNNNILCVFKDLKGVIWVGTNYGLSNFNIYQTEFNFITTSEFPTQGLPSPNVWCFAENDDGRIIFVGTDNYVSFYDRTREQFTHCQLSEQIGGNKIPISDALINDICYVNEDLVLVSTTNGLFKLFYNEGHPYFLRFKLHFPNGENHSSRIYKAVHWRGDYYFLGTRDGVVKLNINTGESKFYGNDKLHPKSSILSGICRYIFKESENKIYFFTSEGGMNYYDEKNDLIRPSRYNPAILKATKDYITSALKINDDYWFSTSGGGILKLNEKTFKTKVFNHKSGLINNVVYGILKDDRNVIWLSTNKGLMSLNTKNNEITSFRDEGEFLIKEYNQGAFMRARDGEMYFGGINGYNFFNPAIVGKLNRNSQVSILEFMVGNKVVHMGKNSVLPEAINFTNKIILNYRQNNISFRIMAEDVGAANIIQYKYVLEGDNNDEVFLGKQNVIHFSNLKNGDYRLKIFAKVGNSDWSKTPKVIEIRIKAPFWKTFWFWSIIFVFGGFGILVFIRQKINMAQREQVFLEMKIAERTKEIRNQNQEIAKQTKIIEEKNKKLEQQKELLEMEKAKTDKVLKNTLPESTFNELRERGSVKARSYDKVSIMFTDFVGFTKISEHRDPAEIVAELDRYFTEFDKIIVANNLEKIKTIGDAYMCAGGIPVRNKTNPIDMCLAALQIQEFMMKMQEEQIKNNAVVWKLRLGINTGGITAGVIGKKKLAYDIWGANVNLANNMEKVGIPNKVTITGNTYEHIKYYFDCESRGEILSKGNEMVKVYTVLRIKPELSENDSGTKPNKKFFKLVNLHLYSHINYDKAEKHIIKLLSEKLPPQLHYHCINHTFDVVSAAERIAIGEGITDENLYLLKTAALYHDAGFVEQYDKNEPIGARMAEEILPNYGYSPEQIATIKRLIFATEVPHHPKDLLEQIICDADLDYLGREDFFEIADNLRIELREHGKLNSDRKWDETQVKFFNMHKYFTQTAINSRREMKLKHLGMIEEKLKVFDYKD